MSQAMARRRLDNLPSGADWSAVTGRLRRIATALTRSTAEADDLTQETLVSLLARNPQRADHTGYGRRTIVRIWLDRQRSFRRRVARLAVWARSAERWHDADHPPDGEERYSRMRRAINALPAQQRAVLVLRLVAELDYADIAKTLDCSIQTVRANLHLGRQRVRKMLGEDP
jgi:RNA polymerase sigma-70 factor (ECF subfamily)